MALTAIFCTVPTAAKAEEAANNTPGALLAENEISRHIDYVSAQQYGHVARVHEEEDLNTLVYLNQDGTKTAYFFGYDVKYEDADGNIKEKDIGLKTVAGGFGLKQSDVDLKLPTDVLDGVEFTHNGNYIKLIPILESVQQTSVAQLVTRPMDAVANFSSNEISYGRAFGANSSLRYTPLINGIKEDIILSSYNGTNTWRFLVNTNGLYPFVDGDGVYYFATTSNAVNKYSLGKVYVYDADGNETYGTMNVTQVKPGAQYIITLEVDDEYLQNAEYPVTVDPTLTIKDESMSDVGIYQNSATTNYGTEVQPYVGYDSTRGKSRVLMRFDSLLNNGVLYNYMDTIQNVTLTLRITGQASTNGTLKLHRFLGTNWTEGGATWSNVSPNNYDSVVASHEITSGGEKNINIPVGYINACKANSAYINSGLILIYGDETSASSRIRIASSEYGVSTARPMLKIQYTTDMSKHFKTDVALDVSKSTSIRKTYVYEDVYTVFSSRNPNVASVNTSGVITAKSTGSTVIDISLWFDADLDGNISTTDERVDLTCNVTVNLLVFEAEDSTTASVYHYEDGEFYDIGIDLSLRIEVDSVDSNGNMHASYIRVRNQLRQFAGYGVVNISSINIDIFMINDVRPSLVTDDRIYTGPLNTYDIAKMVDMSVGDVYICSGDTVSFNGVFWVNGVPYSHILTYDIP